LDMLFSADMACVRAFWVAVCVLSGGTGAGDCAVVCVDGDCGLDDTVRNSWLGIVGLMVD